MSQILHFTFFESQIDCVLFLFTNWLCPFFVRKLIVFLFCHKFYILHYSSRKLIVSQFWSHILHFTFFKFSRLPVDHSKGVFLVPTELVEKTVFRRFGDFRTPISIAKIGVGAFKRCVFCTHWAYEKEWFGRF